MNSLENSSVRFHASTFERAMVFASASGRARNLSAHTGANAATTASSDRSFAILLAVLPSDQPSKIGGYKPRAIAGEHRSWLLARVKEKDFTLRGLVAELVGRGLKVDYRSVWSFVHAEKLSFKKKRGGWRTRSP